MSFATYQGNEAFNYNPWGAFTFPSSGAWWTTRQQTPPIRFDYGRRGGDAVKAPVVVATASGAAAGAWWNYAQSPADRARVMSDLEKVMARAVGGGKISKGPTRRRALRRGAAKIAQKVAARGAMGVLGPAGMIGATAMTAYDLGLSDVFYRLTTIYRDAKLGKLTTGEWYKPPAKPKAPAPGAAARGNAAIVQKAAPRGAATTASTTAKAGPGVPAPVKKPIPAGIVLTGTPKKTWKQAASDWLKANLPSIQKGALDWLKQRDALKMARAQAPRFNFDISQGAQASPMAMPGFAPLTGFERGGVGSPPKEKCKCGPKKKGKPRKPRTVCYRGSFTETATGLSKVKREKIPCRPSSAKPR